MWIYLGRFWRYANRFRRSKVSSWYQLRQRSLAELSQRKLGLYNRYIKFSSKKDMTHISLFFIIWENEHFDSSHPIVTRGSRISLAPPRHTLSAFLHLNDRFQEFKSNYTESFARNWMFTFQNLRRSGRAVETSFIESGAFVRKTRIYSHKNAQVLTLALRLTCKLRHVKWHAEMKKVGLLIYIKIWTNDVGFVIFHNKIFSFKN